MKAKFSIAYTWNRADGKRIKESHREALKETARERAMEMFAKGYTEGELFDNIHMTNRDPEDGIEYNGWWKLA